MLIHTENTAPEVSSGATEHQAEGPFSCRALDQIGYFEGQAGIPAIRTAFEFRLLLIAPPPAGGRRSAGATDLRDLGRLLSEPAWHRRRGRAICQQQCRGGRMGLLFVDKGAPSGYLKQRRAPADAAKPAKRPRSLAMALLHSRTGLGGGRSVAVGRGF